ncbi:hypothetical protein E4T56_gene447 [Termitomyces sp. T112]|nr:hypothetical protein E4T56_gene447 [Termitomyces sp. T112]
MVAAIANFLIPTTTISQWLLYLPASTSGTVQLIPRYLTGQPTEQQGQLSSFFTYKHCKYSSVVVLPVCVFATKETFIVQMMLVSSNCLSNPQPLDSTIIYDEAECRDATEVFIGKGNDTNPHLPFGNPTYYGPIAVSDNPFTKQMGGGGTIKQPQTGAVPWSLCQHVCLIPLGSHNPESHNFACCCAKTASSPTPTSQNTQVLQDFLDGLDDEVIASMAFDCSSPFSSLEAENLTSPHIEESLTSPACIDNAFSPTGEDPSLKVKKDLVLVERRRNPAAEGFLTAGAFEPIVLPPGLTASSNPQVATTSTHMLSGDKTPEPFIKEPADTAKTLKEQPPAVISHPPSSACTLLSKTATSKTWPSNSTLEQCQNGFAHIEEIFVELSHSLQQPLSHVIHCSSHYPTLRNGCSLVRREHGAQAFGIYIRHTLPSIKKRNSNIVHLKMTLTAGQASKENGETTQRLFCKQHLILNGTKKVLTFASRPLLLWLVTAFRRTKALGTLLQPKFVAKCLKLDDTTLLGLVKLEAYHAIAKKITEDVDAEQLINELDKAFDSLEAELKPLPSPPIKGPDDDDDIYLENNSNVISSCKKHLISLLKTATEAAGQCWTSDQLPWTTLPNHLISISHVITRWPPSCAMPTKTSKPKKGKQGIKDLGSKDGHFFLAALQNGKLKNIRSDIKKIKKTHIGPAAPKSTAITYVKQKMAAFIEVESDNEQKSDLPPAKVPKQLPPNFLYTISSNSEDLPLAPMAKQPLPKKHVVNVSTDSDPDDPSPTQKRNPPPPPPLAQQLPIKQNTATGSSSMTKKDLSPPSPTAK